MTKYQVEFTASVTGSMAGRDDGQPYRTNKTITDRIEAFRFYDKCMSEQGKRYGWEAPKLFKMVVIELDGGEALLELDEYEENKNAGAGI